MDESVTHTREPTARCLRGLAELAFGSLTRADESVLGQHLALLQAQSLELDLSDPAQRQFGDYELLERLGEGGMGVVYRARHLPLDRDVAVKLLSAGPWASKDFIARFEREAQNAARMQHPNIVTVYEVGCHEGLHFFSMRLVEGRSLSALLKRGEQHCTYRQAAALLRTMAEAVAYAHSLGVLHLDLKPGNVLIDAEGVPHIADFGLARRLGNVAMVVSDEVSGTPSYMAPEQSRVQSSPLTAATDVWGLGAILYELLTGRPPFRADTAQDTLRLVLEGQVRAPRRWHPELPLDLQAIVLRCLKREPSERYASARTLADDLQRFVENRPVQARPLNAAQKVGRWARREPKLAATLACALAALAIGLGTTSWQWHRARQNATLAQSNAGLATRTLWNSRTATAQKQMEQGDAYAALTNVLANLRGMEAHGDRTDAALARLRIGTVLANAPQLINVVPMGNEQITDLAIAPDARTIAVTISGRKVHLIDVASGKQLWSLDVGVNSSGMSGGGLNQNGLEMHFSRDGRYLIGYVDTGIDMAFASVLSPHRIDSVMIDVATGKLVDPPRRFPGFLATSFSDDGHYALLFDKHGAVQRWRTQPWAPDGDKVEIKGDIDNASLAGPLVGEALLDDAGAKMVLVSDANLRFRVFDAGSMRLRHALVLDALRGRATAWALPRDGRHLAIGTMSGQIALWDLDSGTVTWLPSGMGGWVAKLRFSADGSRLAAVSNEPSEFRVFDPRSGELVAMPVSLDDTMSPNALNGVEFGPDADTVLTQHYATRAILWQLPEAGYPPQAAVAAAPPMVDLYARFALASDARSHLMATSDNGRLKLWRVRWSPLVGGKAAPMVSGILRFDGRHLVSADGKRISVFDVTTGQVVGKAIALPEAPTFADLDGSGRLIAIAGRELSCWNWQNGTPCWPVITLPDSPLRLSLAAHAPMLAVSTGSNKHRRFFEHVLLIDLATGRQRGAPITLRGPLGALRLSGNGQRLLVFEQRDTIADDSNVLRVIDTGSASIVQNLVQDGKPRAQTVDARFADDGSVWSLSGPPAWGGDQQTLLWHWNVGGKLLDKTVIDPDFGTEFGLLPLPHGHGVIETDWGIVFDNVGIVRTKLSVPDEGNRVNVSALSPDGKLLALAGLDGVSLFVVDRNQRLVPDFKLALPNHDAIRQLAFAPDGSRLAGRTMSGHWFQWRIVADTRSVAAIAEDLRLRDFTAKGWDEQGKSAPALPAGELRKLRAADPGASPVPTHVTVINAGATPVPDARYEPLSLDAIANVDPRTPMNRATRVPPQPQSLPTLPRGLQRYDGVDFLLGRAVQLSGSPRNRLDTEFPARSSPLAIAPQRIAAIDVLVFQFNAVAGEAGAVRLRYADGGERELDIVDDRDTYSWLDLEAVQRLDKPRIGWLGTYSTDIRGWGMANSGDAAAVPTNVVRLENPEPNRPVIAISLEAPPAASPGLLFLALTLEPVKASPTHH